MVAVTAIPVAGVFVFAGPILEMFFGLGNEVALWCLRIILIGQLVHVVTGPVGSELVLLGGAGQLIRLSLPVPAALGLSTRILDPRQAGAGVCRAAAFSPALKKLKK